MLPLLFGILLVILIPSIICYYKCRHDTPFAYINATCIALMIIIFVASMVGTIQLVKLPALEQQMILCRNRCDEVTATLTDLTKNYAAYEAAVYGAAADNGLKITYPEANGASLAQQQMKLYDDWQTALYRLEQQVPVCNAWKWWLYFGDSRPNYA